MCLYNACDDLRYFSIIIIIQHLFSALFTNKYALMRYLKLK